jgi:transcriptional regulator with XRE-family HTH domain
LNGEAIPDVRTQKALANALGVPLRDMLIASGLVGPQDLPTADAPPVAPLAETDLEELARRLGIEAGKIPLFVRIVESVAEQFTTDSTASSTPEQPAETAEAGEPSTPPDVPER